MAATSDSPPVVGLCYVRYSDVAAPTLVALRQHLLSRLPLSQMPDVLQEVNALPLTDRGKVDRATLAKRLRPSHRTDAVRSDA